MTVCPICQKSEFELLATRIREGTGRIVRCQRCGLIMQDLAWDEKTLREYYEREYQTTNSLVRGKVQTVEEHYADRMQTIGSVFSQISDHLKPEMAVLDVGCGAGELLTLIKPLVRRCAGVEMNTEFVRHIRDRLHIEAYAGDINHLDLGGRFDLIVCISTLDHLRNPLETLITMRELLAPGGELYIEVPNVEEALTLFLPERTRKAYRTFFWHRAHLFYFSRETLGLLMAKAGFVTKITCRHEYTLKNFLHWYFLGKPQKDFVSGVTETTLFSGTSPFEVEMNALWGRVEREFKEIMSRTFGGDNLCCWATRQQDGKGEAR
mgnify:CR=1 FL=1